MNEVALFEDALRAAIPVQPDPRLGRSLVPRLAQIARTATLETLRREAATSSASAEKGTVTSTAKPARSRRALVARVGIAVAALPLLFAGLAVAGVTVPDAARSAFESVGVDLPNQPADGGSQKHSSGSTSQESSRAAPADQASDQGKEASAKKGANGKGKDDSSKPGRRVRRHGQGPVPGPATAPPGKALGLGKEHGNSSSHENNRGGSGRGGGSAHAGGSQSNSGDHGHGKP